jgi:hypothetical protein
VNGKDFWIDQIVDKLVDDLAHLVEREKEKAVVEYEHKKECESKRYWDKLEENVIKDSHDQYLNQQSEEEKS